MGAISSLGSAIGRFIRGIGYLLTGRLTLRTKTIDEDPGVVRARWDDVLVKKRTQIVQVRNAVAGMIRIVEGKKADLDGTKEQIARHERLISGAKAMAAKAAKGKTREQAEADPEFVKCTKAFADFTSSLKLLNERRAALETDIETADRDSKGYELQLQSLGRELNDMEAEKERAVADIAMARQERQAAEVAAGISSTSLADDIRRLRETVAQAKAEAKVTSRLAGTDTKRQEAEFLSYAGSREAEGQLMDEIFGEKKDAAPTAAAPERETEAAALPDGSGGGKQ